MLFLPIKPGFIFYSHANSSPQTPATLANHLLQKIFFPRRKNNSLSHMQKQILFIQGGGNGGYEADANLVASLQKALGADYEISYPRMQTDEAAADFGWPKQIGAAIDTLNDGVILAAHSLGASLLLKYLSENKVSKKVAGIFLLSTPFWAGKEEWVQGLKLNADFAKNLPNSPMFFYHSRDDEEVPFDHLASYRHKLSTATFREIESGGHQLGGGIAMVAKDIKDL